MHVKLLFLPERESLHFSDSVVERKLIPLSYRQIRSHSALNSTFNSSALLLLYSSALRFAFHTEHRISAFWKVRLKNGAR